MGERLALHGGTPVRSALLPYSRQTIDDEDVQAVLAVLRSDWLTTGPHVDAFERAVGALVGVPHAVAVSSGRPRCTPRFSPPASGPATR